MKDKPSNSDLVLGQCTLSDGSVLKFGFNPTPVNSNMINKFQAKSNSDDARLHFVPFNLVGTSKHENLCCMKYVTKTSPDGEFKFTCMQNTKTIPPFWPIVRFVEEAAKSQPTSTVTKEPASKKAKTA